MNTPPEALPQLPPLPKRLAAFIRPAARSPAADSRRIKKKAAATSPALPKFTRPRRLASSPKPEPPEALPQPTVSPGRSLTSADLLRVLAEYELDCAAARHHLPIPQEIIKDLAENLVSQWLPAFQDDVHALLSDTITAMAEDEPDPSLSPADRNPNLR